MQKKVEQSEEFHFHNIIFRNIKEDFFKPLFSDKESRPNSLINAMVSALILMHRHTWTYEELFKQIQFHILMRIALGSDTLDEMPFCPARFSKYLIVFSQNILLFQGKSSKGQSINIVETANPDNPINLLTDITINPNNKDDSKVIGERIDQLKAKTPDLDEIHFDGAYGCSDNDKKFKRHNINPIQTGVRGLKAEVEIDIEKNSETEYEVSCPHQKVKSSIARKRNKATFNLKKFSACSEQNKCPALMMKKNRMLYFTHDNYRNVKERTLNLLKFSKE